MFKLCHYINDDNKMCNAVAMRGKHYCRHHLELIPRKMRMARMRRRLLESFLQENPLNSRAAVLMLKHRISEGIPSRRLGKAQMQVMASVFRMLDDSVRDLPASARNPPLATESAPVGARKDA